MKQNLELFNQVSAFVNLEADMLDHKEYSDWLSLWSDDGLYVVPVDPTTNEYKNALNIAYDDAEMRRLRVARLESGEAVSTKNTTPTVRSVSRIRIVKQEGDNIFVRCAYCLYESKKDDLRPYPANVDFILVKTVDGFLIQEKSN